MTTFPNSPRLTKGAIVAMDLNGGPVRVIALQYNPEALTRSLQPSSRASEGDRSEVLRLSGAPTETIKLSVIVDAADQLEKGEGLASSVGIYPQLSALEVLLYPSSMQVLANTALLALGTIEVIPAEGPLTLFVWGPRRVVPVRLTEFSITEEAHDARLNPIRANISLGLRVLSYNDLPALHPGRGIFLAHQVIKEVMAQLGSNGAASLF